MADARHDPRRLGADGEDGRGAVVRGPRLPRARPQLAVPRRRARPGPGDGATTVVICEVKTRSTQRFGSPFEAVGRAKQQRLRRLAARWLREAAPFRPDEVRFDVAGVVGRRVEVIEAAL